MVVYGSDDRLIFEGRMGAHNDEQCVRAESQ